MKALIFNSGLGSRLGELTAHCPKSLVRLADDETIFSRQMRILMTCGIRNFVVTTGPFEQLIRREAQPFIDRGAHVTFVANPLYDQTNYIYSMYLARAELYHQDILMLHGDLVFDCAYIRKLMSSPEPSLGSVNAALPQPEKDFKARVIDDEVREVGVGIFDDDCIAFQGLYKLSADSLDTWLAAVERFVEAGNTSVYAENAANTVFDRMHVKAFSYEHHYVEEIDTPEDLERVCRGITTYDYEAQSVFTEDHGQLTPISEEAAHLLDAGSSLDALLKSLGMHRPLVVTDSFFVPRLSTLWDGVLAGFPVFSDFSPNPRYEQVVNGVSYLREQACDGLISMGGGSSIDVAKCIKLFAPLDGDGTNPRFTEMDSAFSPVPHLAIPTTAGTGSEATHFSVVYVEGEKISVSHPCLQPNVALLAPALLRGLPAYQRKSTMLDALCQAIESYWSASSTEQSRCHARRAITLLMAHGAAYLASDEEAAYPVMRASHEAGKAINLTTTTAAHAMSYKLTSIYGIAHGHAVALCLPGTWRVLLERGDRQTKQRLSEIDQLMSGDDHASVGSGLQVFRRLYDAMELDAPQERDENALDLLARSVNVERLSNFPVRLNQDELKELYRSILA